MAAKHAYQIDEKSEGITFIAKAAYQHCFLLQASSATEHFS